jgi:hypothetical protein
MWVKLKLGFANTIRKNLGTAFAEIMPRFENSWILNKQLKFLASSSRVRKQRLAS